MPKSNDARNHSSTRSADSQPTRKPTPRQNDLSGPAGGSGALADVASRPEQMSVSDMPMLQRSVGNKTAQRLVAQRNVRTDRHAVDTPAAQAGIPADLMTDIETMIESKLGSGRPLDEQTRTRLEGSLMTDLSNVRIHTDQDAAWMAQSLNAQAFTVGADIFFNAGMFNPGNPEGDRLLIHELTHVQQQGGGEAEPVSGTVEIDSVSQPGDDEEVAAEQVADQAAAGGVSAANTPETSADTKASVADQAQQDASEETSGNPGATQSAEKKTQAAQQANQAASAAKSASATPQGAGASAENVAAVVEAVVAPGSGISPEGAAGTIAGAALTRETAGTAAEVAQSGSPGEMAGEVAADIAESPAMEQVQNTPVGGGGETSAGESNEGGQPAEGNQENANAGGEGAQGNSAGAAAEDKEEAEDKAKDEEEGAQGGQGEAAGGGPAAPSGGGPVDLPAPDEFEPDPEAELAADPDALEMPDILVDGPAAMGDLEGMGAAAGIGGDPDADSFSMPCMGIEGFGDLFPEMPEELDYALPPLESDVSDPNAKVEADPTGKGVDKMFKDSALSYSGPSKGLDNLKKVITTLDSILQIMDYVTYAAIGMLVLSGIAIAIASLPFWQLAYKIPLIAAFIAHIGTFLTWWGVIYFGVRGLSMILRSIMITVMLAEGVHPDLIRSEADTLTNHAIGTLVDAVMAVGPALYEKRAASKAASKGAGEGAEEAVGAGVNAADDLAGAGAAAGDDVVAPGVNAADDLAGAGAAAGDDVVAPGVNAADDVAQGPAANAVDDVAEGPAANVVDDVAEGPAANVVDDVAEGPAANVVDDVAEGPAANVVDDVAEGPAANVVDDVAEGPAANVVDDVAEGPAANVVDDVAEGPAANIVDDVAEGPAANAADDIVPENVVNAAEEIAQGPAANAADDVVQGPAANVVDDVAEGPAANVVDDVAEGPAANVVDDAAEGPAANVIDDAAEGPAANVVDDAAEGPAANVVDDAAEGPAANIVDDAVPGPIADAADDVALDVAETAAANAALESQVARKAFLKTAYENTRNFILAKLMAYTGTGIQNAAKPIGAEGFFSENTLRGGFGLGKASDQFNYNDLSNTDDRPVSYEGQTMPYADAEAKYREKTGNAEAVLPPGSFTILSPSAPNTGITGEASALITEGPESEGGPIGAGLEDEFTPDMNITPGILQLAIVDYQEQAVQNRMTVLNDEIGRKQKWDQDMNTMEGSLTKAGGDLSATTAYLDQQIINANKAITSYDAVRDNLIATNAMLAAAMIILSVGAYITTDPPIIAMAIMTGIMIAGILATSIASWVKIGERKDEAKAVIANNTKLKADIATQEDNVSQSGRELKTTKERNEEDIGEMQSQVEELEGMLGTLESLRSGLLESCPVMGAADGESEE